MRRSDRELILEFLIMALTFALLLGIVHLIWSAPAPLPRRENRQESYPVGRWISFHYLGPGGKNRYLSGFIYILRSDRRYTYLDPGKRWSDPNCVWSSGNGILTLTDSINGYWVMYWNPTTKEWRDKGNSGLIRIDEYNNLNAPSIRNNSNK